MVGTADGGRVTGGMRGAVEGDSLRDNDLVRIRVATVGDLGGLGDMFSRSSRETIYRRFRMAYGDVPEQMLLHLLDPDRHGGEALVAVAGDEVIGHAMYGRPEGGKAEIGVVVEDGWQSLSVGGLLLTELAGKAAGRGVETFVCYSWHERRTATRLGGPALTEDRRPVAAETRRMEVPTPGLEASPGAVGTAR
jgi:GNAT superfamily N-acetyltransferase